MPLVLGETKLDIPHFTDLELFLLAGWVSYILIRALADSVKLMLYIDFKERSGRSKSTLLAASDGSYDDKWFLPCRDLTW